MSDVAPSSASEEAKEEVAHVDSLVAACIEALEAGDSDPVTRVCASDLALSDTVLRRLRQLAARGLLSDEAAQSLLLPRFGPYRCLRELGSGGMGSVYLAEQSQPVRRQVALKVIKLGMDTREVVARFEAERQALALMSHPHVAQVFDAGHTPEGRPYFAMEYVAGEPITGFCDRRRLPLEVRLSLFAAVCRAVQHAHDRGVIHRDLKPSNILVAEHEGSPMPKIIDFGIAKATGPSAGQTLRTTGDQVLGTPEYMSPEQARSGGLDVDTRSDVYSLGVVLYEVLSGELPFDSLRLRGSGRQEMERILLEEAPKTPSSRLQSAPESVLAARGRGRPTLRRLVAGELDWIVLKALAKDREQRFPSVRALAEDVERFLRHEPVLAGPPSFGYRLRKLVRRHRVPVAAAAIVLVAIVAGLVVSLRATFVAVRAREDQAATLLDARAFFDLARDSIAGFVELAGDGLQHLPRAEPVRQAMLEDALRFYQGLRARRPIDRSLRLELAYAQERIGLIHREMGRLDAAMAALDEARRESEALRAEYPEWPAPPLRLAQVLANLGAVHLAALRRQEARAAAREALAVLQELRERGYEDTRGEAARIEGAIHHNLGVDQRGDDDLRPAAESFARSIACLERAVALEPSLQARVSLAVTRGAWADALARLGEIESAESAARRTVDQLEALQREHASADLREASGTAHTRLSTALRRLGRLTDAAAEEGRAIDIAKSLASDHPNVPEHRSIVAGRLQGLAEIRFAQQDWTGAAACYREAIAGLQALQQEHGQARDYRLRLAEAWNGLANALLNVRHEGQLDLDAVAAALAQARASIDALRAERPQDTEVAMLYASIHSSTAILATEEERIDEALAELGRVRQVLESLLVARPRWADVRSQLATVLHNAMLLRLRRGDLEGAVLMGRASFEAGCAGLRIDPGNLGLRALVPRQVGNYASALLDAQDFAGAAAAAEELVRLLPDHAEAHFIAAGVLAECTGNGPDQDRERYGALAVVRLRRTIELGHVFDDDLVKETTYAPLRRRADFRELVLEHRKRAKGR